MRGGNTTMWAVLLGILLQASVCAAQQPILWHDPGPIEHIDFALAAGQIKTRPQPPLYFIEEKFGGTSPKLLVRDAAGVQWRVKGGVESKSENFATRLVAALGYYAEPTWYIRSGKIVGAHDLKRAAGFIQPDGSFSDSAFELRDPTSTHLEDQDWAWNSNPFTAAKEFHGLKVLTMLLSNWDNKDVRNRDIGSNTGIIERRAGSQTQWIYFVSDWGQTLGAWGTEMKPQGWNCAEFSRQTKSFVLGAEAQFVRFGFEGQHMEGFKGDITIADVRWLVGYLGRVSDDQLRSGLKASAATTQEVECFTKALRERISQLQNVSRAAPKEAAETGSATTKTR